MNLLKNIIKRVEKLLKKLEKQKKIVQLIIVLGLYFIIRHTIKLINWSFMDANYLENFDNNGENQFILFHWNQCGHCKKMMPDWNKLKKQTFKNCKIVEYEKDENPEQMKKHDIKGFPTIKLLKSDGNVVSYDGERNVLGFSNFIKKHTE
jgi:thiol-disulfide isomerase/thioredoxin